MTSYYSTINNQIGAAMEKIILLCVLISLLTTTTNAQVREIESRSIFNQGDWEFNISTNIGVGFLTSTSNTTTQNLYPYDSSYYEYSYNNTSRPFNLLITASAGYCILDGLVIEPEIDINLITDADISLTLLSNVSYNFHIPRRNIFPFIKLGFGFSNYYPDHRYSSGSEGSSLDTRVINAGAGLKFSYTSGVALKLEINYKNYSSSFSNSYNYPEYRMTENGETAVDAITLSLGFSILL